MHKTFWFGVGFGAALLMLTGVLVIAPLLSDSTSEATSPSPTRFVSPDPTSPPAARPEPAVAPSPLRWWREGGLAGRCEHVEIDGSNLVHYAPCEQGPRVAHLSWDELLTYMEYLEHYVPCEYGIQDSAESLTSATIRLNFVGRGSHTPSEEERSEIAQWASALYERLTSQEQRDDLVAAARLHLAARLGLSVDAISTLSVEKVTWPDACLGIRSGGLFCAQVSTPGYRVTLEAEDGMYEYRTDLHGLVRGADAQSDSQAQSNN